MSAMETPGTDVAFEASEIVANAGCRRFRRAHLISAKHARIGSSVQLREPLLATAAKQKNEEGTTVRLRIFRNGYARASSITELGSRA